MSKALLLIISYGKRINEVYLLCVKRPSERGTFSGMPSSAEEVALSSCVKILALSGNGVCKKGRVSFVWVLCRWVVHRRCRSRTGRRRLRPGSRSRSRTTRPRGSRCRSRTARPPGSRCRSLQAAGAGAVALLGFSQEVLSAVGPQDFLSFWLGPGCGFCLSQMICLWGRA